MENNFNTMWFQCVAAHLQPVAELQLTIVGFGPKAAIGNCTFNIHQITSRRCDENSNDEKVEADNEVIAEQDSHKVLQKSIEEMVEC